MLHLTIFTLTLSLSLVLSNAQGIQLPKPLGPFKIGTTSFELTDHSRLDPFAPTPQNRSVQLSICYPIADGNSLPFSTYLPPLTTRALEMQFGVPAGSIPNISTRAHLNAPILGGGRNTPVILYSPGFGNSRFLGTMFVQELASEGYAVVSIDHPYDASVVELSDGRVITANISDSPEDITRAVAVRAADARFILDELETGCDFKVPGLHKGLDTTRVGFFGHSLGGATAGTAMVLDSRIVAGVNMDGSFFGPDIQRGLTKPFVIMASKGDNRTTDFTWGEVWPKLRGFKREIEIEGAEHGTFTDGPVLADLLGVKSELEDFVGTIAARRVEKIQHAYLTAFFDFAVRGKKKEKLLDGPSKEFPEVTFASQV